MPRTKEEIYARSNEYRRKRYKTDETFREYYQTKAMEYNRKHKEEKSAYHKEWRRRNFLISLNSKRRKTPKSYYVKKKPPEEILKERYPDENFLRVKQVAEMLKCSVQKVYYIKKNYYLPTYKVGNHVCFSESDIKKFIEKYNIK